MRLFFEAYKRLKPEEETLGIPQQMLRIEISTEDDAYMLKDKYKDTFDEFYIHYCYHDEGKPCKLKPI